MVKPSRRALGWAPLLATIYFCVSGGPYGLEEVMQSGHGMAIILILLTPVVWAAPAALITAELASAIPAEGGYYVWTKRALGPFWGFLCGWWTWVYSWVDCAVYPTLFAAYVATIAKLYGYGTPIESQPVVKWLVGLLVVVPLTWGNLRGARTIGRASIAMGVALLLPFVALAALGMNKVLANPSSVVHPLTAQGQTAGAALSAGLFAVMWNYLGWDSMSTVAGETDQPQTSFPRAIAWCMPLVIASYLVPSVVGMAYLPNPADWVDGAWVTVAGAIEGKWFAAAVTIAGLIAYAGLFGSTLLASSRIPFVLAEDGLLPRSLAKLHPRYGTPVTAILVSAAVYTVLSYSSFERLAVIDVIVYSCGIMLELAALAVLRKKAADLSRPFRIPGGWPVIWLVVLSPSALVAFAAYSQYQAEGAGALALSAAALASGPIVYALARRRQARSEPAPESRESSLP